MDRRCYAKRPNASGSPPVNGASATLTWIVEKNDVGEGAQVIISLMASSEFHRHGTHDGVVVFVYPVDPPN